MSMLHTMPSRLETSFPEALSGVLAESLLGLLDKADLDLARTGFPQEIDSPRGTIRHAASILRIALEQQTSGPAASSSPGTLAAWQINRVRRYIDENLSERINVEDLSQVARRSTAHFCRAFKRSLGETPHSFVTRRRLHRAQKLMLTSQDSLSTIAIACGFSDQAHFCNRFREATGVSPAAWRRERCEEALIVDDLLTGDNIRS
jgi:AraC family transcriptional regulator